MKNLKKLVKLVFRRKIGRSEIRDKKKIIFVYHDLEGCTCFMSSFIKTETMLI